MVWETRTRPEPAIEHKKASCLCAVHCLCVFTCLQRSSIPGILCGSVPSSSFHFDKLFFSTFLCFFFYFFFCFIICNRTFIFLKFFCQPCDVYDMKKANRVLYMRSGTRRRERTKGNIPFLGRFLEQWWDVYFIYFAWVERKTVLGFFGESFWWNIRFEA